MPALSRHCMHMSSFFSATMHSIGASGGASGKESAQAVQRGKTRFYPWVGKIPRRRRAWQHTPVFAREESMDSTAAELQSRSQRVGTGLKRRAQQKMGSIVCTQTIRVFANYRVCPFHRVGRWAPGHQPGGGQPLAVDSAAQYTWVGIFVLMVFPPIPAK